jgi:4-hydroxy-3-polyprenylbenzoate decarboxylase
MKKYCVAISGASGSIYGVRLVGELLRAGHEAHLIVSSESFGILRYETGIDWLGQSDQESDAKIKSYYNHHAVTFYNDKNLWAPLASGSFLTQGMIVAPCSMKTLAGIAHGVAGTLIERAADATIKEGRQLILSPRETPLSAIHLENMLKLARLGVKIVPPMPGFYHKPAHIDDLINFVVGKTLDAIGVEHQLFKRWQSNENGYSV